MRSRVLAAVLVLLALGSGPARAGEVPLLGARLDTSGTWVAVISKATIPTHVELASEGDVHLSSASFDIAPGERREVAYTGSGLGWVSARMTPINATGSTGALELRAWVRYVAPPESTFPGQWPLWGFLAVFLAALVVIVRRVRHAR